MNFKAKFIPTTMCAFAVLVSHNILLRKVEFKMAAESVNWSVTRFSAPQSRHRSYAGGVSAGQPFAS